MELRHLRYFIAVAEHLNFGRAAEALNTAQPSLSQQIRQLEDELGTQLFDRTSRKVRLTEPGRVFLGDARRTVEQAELSVRNVREATRGERGRLRLGFLPGALIGFLAPVIREFRHRHPEVELRPHVMSHAQQVAALIDGSLDLGLVMAGIEEDRLVERRLRPISISLAIPADHRLAGKNGIRLQDLRGEPLVLLSRRVEPTLYHRIITEFDAVGFDVTDIEEADGPETAIGLVAAGFGIALIPSGWEALVVPHVLFRPIVPAIETISGAFCWDPLREAPIVTAFLEAAAEHSRLTDGSASRPINVG